MTVSNAVLSTLSVMSRYGNTRSARIMELIKANPADVDQNNNARTPSESSSPARSVPSLSSSGREWWDDVFRPDSNDSEYPDDSDASTDKPLPPKRAKKQLSFSPRSNLDSFTTPHGNATRHRLQPIVLFDNSDVTVITGELHHSEEVIMLPLSPTIPIENVVEVGMETELPTQFAAPSSPAAELLATPGTSSSGRRRRTPRILSDSSARKRSRNPSKWKAKIAKAARDSGQKYINIKGKEVKARAIGEPCSNCKFKCSSRVNEDHRKAIFTQFWDIQNHSRQWDFITRHTKIKGTERCTTNWESRRKFSRFYFFRIDGREEKVCKSMFVRTLGICDFWIRTAARKLGPGGSVSPDKRGTNSKRVNVIHATTKQSVRNHINSLEKIPSHYCRASSNREYLPASLNVRKSYELYKEWFGEQTYDVPVKTATERQYRDIFNKEFNISFYVPKKDQCDQCTKFKNSNSEEQTLLQANYDVHISNKQAARDLKDQDKKDAKLNKELCVACFDLQKVLNAPQGETSGFYYKSKLSVFNFTVFDLGICEGHAYVWHEAIAKRGSNEVGSFLHNYIITKVERGVKEFRFYCDNCAGQNKNRFIYSLFLHLAAKYNITITLRFLEVGHTQTEGDSMHALIERRARRKEIYTPDEWITLIKLAKDTTPPYIVHEVSQTDIFDLKILLEGQNWEKNVEGKVILWSLVREVHVTGSTPTTLYFKYNYTDEYSSMSTKARVGRPVNIANIALKPAYHGKLPLGERLLKGLADLCVRQLIPSNRHNFFKGLCADNEVPWPNPPKSRSQSKVT